jgi:hypothetical protein
MKHLNQKIESWPFLRQTYNRFGTQGKASGGAIFHGRTSTNNAALVNVHPIVKHGWTLIHNGVVSNHGRKYEEITSNDTEHLVEYLAHEGISGIEANLTGYYAVAAFSPDGMLHIIRDDRANLHGGWVDSLESFIFATSAEHIKAVCKHLKVKAPMVQPFEDNTYAVFSGSTIVSVSPITPRGYSTYESKYAAKSLGYTLDDEDSYDPYPTTKYAGNVVDVSSKAKPEIDDQGFTNDELEFLTEIKRYADSSYTFHDLSGQFMDYREFMKLDDSEKVCCLVIRSDGTIVDPVDYESERIYSGAV